MQETQEMQVQSLGPEDTLEGEMVTHSSIFSWRIPWTEEPGGLQSNGLQRVRHDWATKHAHYSIYSYYKVLALFPVLYNISLQLTFYLIVCTS